MNALLALEYRYNHPFGHLFEVESIDTAIYLVIYVFAVFVILLLHYQIYKTCDCLIVKLHLMHPRNYHTPPIHQNIGDRLFLSALKGQIFFKHNRLIRDYKMIELNRPIIEPNHHNNFLLFSLLMLDYDRMQFDTCHLIDLTVNYFEFSLISQTTLLETDKCEEAIGLINCYYTF